jgi:hypothetical protein
MFDSIPVWRKYIIVFATSWTTLAACFSSTSLLSASTEIAADLHTTPEVVSLSTAGLIFAIGLSALVWSPIAAVSFDSNISDENIEAKWYRLWDES